MLKSTLILFPLLFTTESVSSLECYVTNSKACEGITDVNEFHKCLNKNNKKQKCEPPNDVSCARSHILKQDFSFVDVCGCCARQAMSDAPKICEELLAPYGHKLPIAGEWKSMMCQSCNEESCNKPQEVVKKSMGVATTAKPKSKNNAPNAHFFACQCFLIIFTILLKIYLD